MTTVGEQLAAERRARVRQIIEELLDGFGDPIATALSHAYNVGFEHGFKVARSSE